MYNLTATEMDQPLLIVKSSKASKNDYKLFDMIPEFCHLTGKNLTE